jgi:hypothetical protein
MATASRWPVARVAAADGEAAIKGTQQPVRAGLEKAPGVKPRAARHRRQVARAAPPRHLALLPAVVLHRDAESRQAVTGLADGAATAVEVATVAKVVALAEMDQDVAVAMGRRSRRPVGSVSNRLGVASQNAMCSRQVMTEC